MKLTTYIVDSFTDTAFKGNPAGVCLLTEAISDDQMLAIAQELGLSETAFIQAIHKEKEDNHFSIRYFSPKMEIPLCGHATLAASKVLFQEHPFDEQIQFTTIEDLHLNICREATSIAMEFPVYQTVPQTAPMALLEALGIDQINHSAYNQEMNMLLVEIDDCKQLRQLQPDFQQLKASHDSIHGVVVTAASDQADYDFESRYFWPWSGTNEDPVTGATHTFLGNYWGKKLKKTKMNAFQCSQRSGFMEIELLSSSTMTLKSKAHIVLKGELTL